MQGGETHPNRYRYRQTPDTVRRDQWDERSRVWENLALLLRPHEPRESKRDRNRNRNRNLKQNNTSVRAARSIGTHLLSHNNQHDVHSAHSNGVGSTPLVEQRHATACASSRGS
jgi:hypothetical protein